mgnify:CR=1 FL=1
MLLRRCCDRASLLHSVLTACNAAVRLSACNWTWPSLDLSAASTRPTPSATRSSAATCGVRTCVLRVCRREGDREREEGVAESKSKP